ncbi:helix-hairpin-helix domain-containing protein [Rubrivirga sp.]|uniref:helix-hairpin-helix domain-containing protein n=1 Tax=Rubrivirga sp. TaxID=1885344 RepID=UPI003C70BB2E
MVTVPPPASASGEDEAAIEVEIDNVDLTKIYGLGDTMAEQLIEAGIDSYQAVADADVETLREIISADGTDDQSVNEETWAKQAQFFVDDDLDGLDTYVEELREADGNVVEIEDDLEVERPVEEDASESAEENAGPNPQNQGDNTSDDGNTPPASA